MSYDITSIGNPYMSAIGAFGLGGSGMYGSYSDPTMMGLGNIGAYSPYAMGMGGVMGYPGMYNPAFMSQITQTQQNIEKSQLQHSTDMHTLMLRNNVEHHEVQDRTLFEKSMVDASVKKGILNLASKVREGDQNGICTEFDALKQTLFQKYRDYFEANSYKINPNDSVINLIDELYYQIISASTGEQCTLRDDIKKFGQTPFEHGFIKNWRGNDYHEKYSDETISYIYGTPLDNKIGKDRRQKYGKYAEKGAEMAAAGAIGAVALPTTLTIGKGILNTFNPSKAAREAVAKTSCFNKQIAWLGAIGLAIGDWFWQQSRAET